MLGQPFLTLGQHAGNAQSQALLAEQHVAAVAAAHRPDRVVLGEVQNQATVDVEVGLAVQAPGELSLGAKRIHHLAAHAGHDAHVEHHVDAVSQLDADLGERRADRAHGERHHVHGAALHGTGEDVTCLAVGFTRAHPVVGGSSVTLEARADVGEVFGAGHVVGRRPVKVAPRQLLLVQRDDLAGLDCLGSETLSFFITTIAPVDAIRLAHGGHRVDPFLNMRILDRRITICGTNRLPGSTGGWLCSISGAADPISPAPGRPDIGCG